MDSGSFIGITPCPAYLGTEKCQAMANVYDQGSDCYTSICTGSYTPWGSFQGQHQQFFGDYYLYLVDSGSSPV